MRFKKHISILLAFFLLVSNVGFAVDIHYCGGKVASIKPIYLKIAQPLNEVEKSCCAPKTTAIVEKNNSCCKDKVINFQKKSENVTLKSFSFLPDFTYLLTEWNPIVFSEISNFENSRISSYYCYANAPPLFKLYHQYLFYA